MKKSLFCVILILIVSVVYPNDIWQTNLFEQNQFSTYLKNSTNIEKTYTLQNRNNLILNNTQTDDNGFRVIEYIYLLWSETGWYNNQKVTYTYDLNNLLIEASSELWENEQWNIYLRYLCTYNEEQNVIEQSYEFFENGEWTYSGRTCFTYNDNEELIERLNQSWEDDEWINFSKTYYINDNGHCIEETSQDWDYSLWINDRKYTYDYDTNNNLIETLAEEWEGNDWANLFHITSTYENNLLSVHIYENWDNLQWNLNTKEQYFYNDDSLLTERLTQSRENEQWINLSDYLYTYDNENECHEKPE